MYFSLDCPTLQEFLIFVTIGVFAEAGFSEQEKMCVNFTFENETLSTPDDIEQYKKFLKDSL